MRHHTDSVLARLLAFNLTGARDSVAAAQIIGALAWRPAASSSWQLEGGASAASFQLTQFGAHGNGSGWVRLRHHATQRFGVIAGGAVGHTRRRSTSGHTSSIDVGAWFTGGTVTADVSLSRLRTEDSLLMAASQVFTKNRSAWLDLRDAVVTASWTHGPLAMTVSHKWRTGVIGTEASQAAFAGTATYAATPRVSVVLGAGRQLADPHRGGPDATIGSASLRLSFADIPNQTRPARESEISVARIDDTSVVIVRVHAGPSARVDVAGSFSAWEPVPVTRNGAYWEAQIRVSPGRHRIAYRIDGGAWRAPAGLARLREFDGEVGLMVIP